MPPRNPWKRCCGVLPYPRGHASTSPDPRKTTAHRGWGAQSACQYADCRERLAALPPGTGTDGIVQRVCRLPHPNPVTLYRWRHELRRQAAHRLTRSADLRCEFPSSWRRGDDDPAPDRHPLPLIVAEVVGRPDRGETPDRLGVNGHLPSIKVVAQPTPEDHVISLITYVAYGVGPQARRYLRTAAGTKQRERFCATGAVESPGGRTRATEVHFTLNPDKPGTLVVIPDSLMADIFQKGWTAL